MHYLQILLFCNRRNDNKMKINKAENVTFHLQLFISSNELVLCSLKAGK